MVLSNVPIMELIISDEAPSPFSLDRWRGRHRLSRQGNSKWYYFYADSFLAKNTKMDGYEIDKNDVRKNNRNRKRPRKHAGALSHHDLISEQDKQGSAGLGIAIYVEAYPF